MHVEVTVETSQVYRDNGKQIIYLFQYYSVQVHLKTRYFNPVLLNHLIYLVFCILACRGQN